MGIMNSVFKQFCIVPSINSGLKNKRSLYLQNFEKIKDRILFHLVDHQGAVCISDLHRLHCNDFITPSGYVSPVIMGASTCNQIGL